MQPYGSLSQGEKQKVLIARALIQNPRLLILDEPCAGLDLISREQIFSLIQDIGNQASGPTILYVSHHIEEILPVSLMFSCYAGVRCILREGQEQR